MTRRSTQKKRDPNDGRIILAGIGLLIAASLVVFFVVTRGDTNDPAPPPMTLEPQVIINLTQIPQATPLSGEDADTWTDFRAMVAACDAYSPERRAQMEQHITWLIDPSDMPRDVILAMGSNPTERLVFGMAGYTSIQWRLNDRPPDSCLIPIGLALNEMLVALGSAPFDIYDGTAENASP